MKLLPMNPIHYVLSADWKYVPAGQTDIRKTFKRIREKLAEPRTIKPVGELKVK